MTNESSIFLILAAKPGIRVSLPGFFHVGSDTYNLIANPPYLRRSGWNLRTLDTPRLVSGSYWEVENGDRKKIQLYSDGNLIVLADLGKNFLGWRRDDEEEIVNPLAITEFIYEFVELYRKILCASKVNVENFKDIEFQVRASGIDNAAVKPKLIPHGIDQWGFLRDIHDGEFRLKEDFSESVHVKYDGENIYDSRYVAMELLRLFYRRGEVPDSESTAYVSEDDDGRDFVDIQKIVKNER